MDYKYSGIILNKFDVGETDRLYSIFTLEAGKIRAKAIGVKKPNAKLAGNLEPITKSEIFMAKNRGQGNITGAITLNNYLAIKSNIDATEKIFYVFGIINKLIRNEEKDEKIFFLISQFLETMENLYNRRNVGNEGEIVSLGFLFKFLESLGYKIDAEKCIICGNKLLLDENYFIPESGGIACKGCSRRIIRKNKISSDAIKLLRVYFVNRIENLGKVRAGNDIIKNLKIIVKDEIAWISD